MKMTFLAGTRANGVEAAYACARICPTPMIYFFLVIMLRQRGRLLFLQSQTYLSLMPFRHERDAPAPLSYYLADAHIIRHQHLVQ